MTIAFISQASLLLASVLLPFVLGASVCSEEQYYKHPILRQRTRTEVLADGWHGDVSHWRALLWPVS